MGEARGKPSFAEEPRTELFVAGEILGESLERHRPFELDVARQIDDRPSRRGRAGARSRTCPQRAAAVNRLLPLCRASPCARAVGRRRRRGGRRRAGDPRASSLTPLVSGSRKRRGTRCAFTAAITEARSVGRELLRRAAVAGGERGCDRVGLLLPRLREHARQLRLCGGAACRAAPPQPARATDRKQREKPVSLAAFESRSASSSGSPPSRISAWVRAMSYSTRRKLARSSLEVEQEIRGARIAVARLAHRARVEQPAGAVELELRSAGREPAVEESVAQRDLERGVAVADEHERLLGQREASPRRPRPRGRTPTRDRARCRGRARRLRPRPAARARRGTVATRRSSTVRVHAAASPASPLNSARSIVPRTARSWFPARQVVARSSHERAALVRPRPVADEVAEAPELVGRVGVDRLEHGLERVEVGVDVGDDGRTHRYSLAARRPARVGTVAGTIGVTRSSSPHAPAATPVTAAARSFAPRDDAEESGGDEVEPAHRRRAERRVLEPRDRMSERGRHRRLVEGGRRRPDL